MCVFVCVYVCVCVEELNYLYCSRSGDKIEKNEKGVACSAFGVGFRRIQGLGGET